MRILIAFDKFKDALGAPDACHAVAAALRRARPAWELDLAPLSDGGDGFSRILTEAAGGSFEALTVSGPCFDANGAARRVTADIGWVDPHRLSAAARERLALPDPTARRWAVIEMAAVNGLALVPSGERDVWRASSRGTGELLAAAARGGAEGVLLGVGGSATSDLGLGALGAIGLGFAARDGRVIEPAVPARWAEVARLTGRVSWQLPLRIACDVDNPLIGARGAAAVYGPQKGLQPKDLPAFEVQAARLARLLSEHVGSDPALAEAPGAGAAGGIAFGLLAAAGARLVSGFALVSEWLDLAARAARADWVITGEGRFDATSLAGKGPGALATLARASGRRALVLAGAVDRSESVLDALTPSVEVEQISPPGLPLDRALADTRSNLERALQAWLERTGV
jgi:glycerate kinase